MPKPIKIILGFITIICGISCIIFGISLLVRQQSWLMFGALITFGGIGTGLIQLGNDLIRGRSVRESIAFILFVGRRAP